MSDVAAGVQHVEEVGAEAVAAAGDGVGGEVGDRVLEAARRAVVGHADRLAVEHQIVTGQRRHEVDHAGRRVGDLVEVAREQAHLAIAAVGLEPGAVELPLHRRLAGLAQRVGDVGRRRREHRADRPTRAKADPRQSVGTAGERQASGRRQLPRQHVRPPHRVGGHGGAGGDRLDHHAVERSLTQLATEHAPQQALLARGRAIEHRPQQLLARGDRPGAGGRGQLVEPAVDLEDLQAGRRRRVAFDAAERAPPDADASLARLAGQHADGHHDLGGGQRAQRRGEELALVGALRRRRHPLGHLGERDEQHVVTLRRRRIDVVRDSGARNRA